MIYSLDLETKTAIFQTFYINENNILEIIISQMTTDKPSNMPFYPEIEYN